MSDPTPEKSPPKRGAVDPKLEDRTKDGWPAIADNPFCSEKYYLQFPEPLRPTFDFAGNISATMTSAQAEKLSQDWAKDWPHITVVNACDKEWVTSLLGPERDTYVFAKVPPFGVLRGALLGEVSSGGIQGSRFYLRYPISPVGDCDEESDVTEPMANGERISSCNRFGCKRAGHFDVKRTVHSIKHGQFFAWSIGEAFPDPLEPTKRSAYIPPFEETQARLMAFKKIDGRQAINLFIMDRLEKLRDREASIRVRTDEGKGIPGR